MKLMWCVFVVDFNSFYCTIALQHVAARKVSWHVERCVARDQYTVKKQTMKVNLGDWFCFFFNFALVSAWSPLKTRKKPNRPIISDRVDY